MAGSVGPGERIREGTHVSQILRLDSHIWRWTVTLPLLLATLIWAGSAHARAVPDSFADLAEKLLPVVVNISTTQVVESTGGSEEFEEFFREFFERRGEQPQRRQERALGSGFIIDSSGYIVTNHHVIEGADEITVLLHDGTSLVAEVIGSDEKTDLAILKVANGKPLPAAEWGDSDKTRIGDWVIAIGNPFGLGGTVTAGIVSARERDIRAGPYDDFIQTDAAINKGNSGGPMFNLDGRVIGINSVIISPSGGSAGIGFAIASNLARNVIEQLRDFGRVRRGWLGVRIQTVTDELAEGLRLDDTTGALVASVTEEGPAEAAGIEQGDVILKFDGRDVTEMRKLPRLVAETGIGKAVDVVIWRKGEEVTLQVELGELDEEEMAAVAPGEAPVEEQSSLVESLGLKLAQLTPELRTQFELGEDLEGVVITDVEAEGTAAEKGLRPGDIIVEVDQEEVRTPGDVADKVEQAKDEKFRVVTLLVFRQGDFQWVAVRLDHN
jgi:serine protease Do